MPGPNVACRYTPGQDRMTIFIIRWWVFTMAIFTMTNFTMTNFIWTIFILTMFYKDDFYNDDFSQWRFLCWPLFTMTFFYNRGRLFINKGEFIIMKKGVDQKMHFFVHICCNTIQKCTFLHICFWKLDAKQIPLIRIFRWSMQKQLDTFLP